MNRLAVSLLTGVAALGFISSVQAADLIISEPAPPVGIIDVAGNWDGVYVGAFAGYGWGTVTDEDGGFDPAGTETDLTGWQVGVNAGFDVTVSEAIVAGIVGDIAWTDLGGDLAAGGRASDGAGRTRRFVPGGEVIEEVVDRPDLKLLERLLLVRLQPGEVLRYRVFRLHGASIPFGP